MIQKECLFIKMRKQSISNKDALRTQKGTKHSL